MISGIWTSSEFRNNTRVVIGTRKPLLVAIELVLDKAHAAPQGEHLLWLHEIEEACNQWLEAHPHTSATPAEGKKFSNRRKGIEALLAQVTKKRQELYKLSPEELVRRKALHQDEVERRDQMLGPQRANPLKTAPSAQDASVLQDPRKMKERAGFHQELLENVINRAEALGHQKEDFNPEQIGYLAAKSALKIAHITDAKNREACKIEAMRVLMAMLGKNRDLAKKFETSGVEVIVVPANTPMTALPEFASLSAHSIQQEGGSARNWDETRGVGGLSVPSAAGVTKVYVAVTEENLLGTLPTGPAAAVAGAIRYPDRYSTSTHEFAHSLHLNVLTQAQKDTIKSCFDKKKKVRIVPNALELEVKDSTFLNSPTTALLAKPKLDGVFEDKWTDGPRQLAAPSTNVYKVKRNGACIMQPAPNAGQVLTYTPGHELKDCYAAFDEKEYFAQCVNAYLGSNAGTDPFTNQPRNNGEAWVRANCEPEMIALLDTLFSAGTGFGNSELPDTNVHKDTGDEITIADHIRQTISDRKKFKQAILARRVMAGGDDED